MASNRLPVILVVLAAVVVLAPRPASAAEARASLPDIEDEVMCTICGTLLAESQSPQSERERALIRRLIARGDDKEQIKDALVAQYGSNVLALPEGGGFNVSSWLVPLLGFSAAVVALGLGARRVRRRGSRVREPVGDLTEAERKRLETDLSAFDR